MEGKYPSYELWTMTNFFVSTYNYNSKIIVANIFQKAAPKY